MKLMLFGECNLMMILWHILIIDNLIFIFTKLNIYGTMNDLIALNSLSNSG